MAASPICPNCGYYGSTKTVTPGSILIELILWLFLIIPGLIYSVWRITSRHSACPKCGGQNMVPLDTPRGRDLYEQFYSKPHGDTPDEHVTTARAIDVSKPNKSSGPSGSAVLLLVLIGLCVVGWLAGEMAKKRDAALPRPPTANTAPVADTALVVFAPTATHAAVTALPVATPTPGMMYVSAGGEGVYVRSTPDMEARYRAWPDGTAMVVIELAPTGWIKVRSPDSYVGFIPAEYLSAQKSLPTAPAPTASPVYVAPMTPGVYYLWYKSEPSTKVAVIGPSHRSGPADTDQLVNWFLAGTACVVTPGTKAYRGSTSGPLFTVAIEVGEGSCRGFAGWVPLEAWQTTPP